MTFHKIFDAFPAPKFLNISFAGISISDSAVRCIKFIKKDSGLFIEKYSEKPIPAGVITSGQINNKEELVKILTELKKELHLHQVKVSMPEEKAYLFTAKIPLVKRSEVQSSVESKIEENVPVPPAELIFDYEVVDHRNKDHLDVVVSNLPISVVDTYVEMITSAGMTLLSLEMESQAAAHALLKPENMDTVLIVHFGSEKVGLYVVSENLVHFTSTLQIKGEAIKNPEFLEQEIKKLYVYWHTLKDNFAKPERKIKEIIVCGEEVGENVVSYLTAHNDVKVALGNVWTNVFDLNKHVPDVPFADSLKFAPTIGVALPSSVLIYKKYV